MDIQMPGLDGFQTTREIRRLESARNTHLPIIAITAHALGRDRERCLAEGMDAYLSKPIKPDELFAALKQINCVGKQPISATRETIQNVALEIAI